MEEIPCDVCGRSEFDTLATKDKRGLPVHTVICRSCGLIFLSPRLTSKALENLYKYDNSAYVQKIPRSLKEICNGQIQKGKEYIEFLNSHITGKERILEIGCGTGRIPQPFKEMGCECVGVESMEDYGKYASREIGVEVITGFFDKVSFDPHSFDMVIISATLNHLPYPSKTFFKIRGLLKPKGKVLVAENDSLWAATWKNFSTISHFDHLYMFTPGTLNNLFQKTGFRIVKKDIQKKKYKILAEVNQAHLETTLKQCNRYYEIRRELMMREFVQSMKKKTRKILGDVLVERLKTILPERKGGRHES